MGGYDSRAATHIYYVLRSQAGTGFVAIALKVALRGEKKTNKRKDQHPGKSFKSLRHRFKTRRNSINCNAQLTENPTKPQTEAEFL